MFSIFGNLLALNYDAKINNPTLNMFNRTTQTNYIYVINNFLGEPDDAIMKKAESLNSAQIGAITGHAKRQEAQDSTSEIADKKTDK
ncbi:MAG: hypothetical protein FWE95_06175 [Planctomycetaceae bacterium]|nr:hypothetical protein [Planctomycetaceae bacterium]